MFSFRKDKTGFFVTIILSCLFGVALLAPLGVLLFGDWNADIWLLKWVWGTCWVLAIVTVLARLAIFRWQMLRGPRQQPPPLPPTTNLETTKTEKNDP
jgi:hypothetical protein